MSRDATPTFDRMQHLAGRLTGLSTAQELTEAEQVIHMFQRDRNVVYRRFLDHMGSDEPLAVPVEVFKHTPVTCHDPADAELVFRSSGTGDGARRSTHYVRFADVYARVAAEGFRRALGMESCVLAAHVPAYAPESSLVWMLRHLQASFGAPGSVFTADDPDRLHDAIRSARDQRLPLVLFGAAFGLLDLAESGAFRLPADAVVVETGGMKTHRRERTRDVLHAELADGFGCRRSAIRSEYGMCELLSQAYSVPGDMDGDPGGFVAPPWMRLRVVRPETDRDTCGDGEEGVLEVTDLANLFSLSFVRTEDRAVQLGDRIHILGRLPQAALRGCNFLME